MFIATDFMVLWKLPRQEMLLAGTYRVVLRPIANEIGRHRANERHISCCRVVGSNRSPFHLREADQLRAWEDTDWIVSLVVSHPFNASKVQGHP